MAAHHGWLCWSVITIERLHRQISGLEAEVQYRVRPGPFPLNSSRRSLSQVDRRDNPWKEENARLADIVDGLRENVALLEQELIEWTQKPPPLHRRISELEAEMILKDKELQAVRSEFEAYRSEATAKITALEVRD